VIAQIGRKAAKCDGIVSFAAGAGYCETTSEEGRKVVANIGSMYCEKEKRPDTTPAS